MAAWAMTMFAKHCRSSWEGPFLRDLFQTFLDFFCNRQTLIEGYLLEMPLSENPAWFFATVSGNDMQVKMWNRLSSRHPVILKYVEPAGLIGLDQSLSEFLSMLENGEQLIGIEIKDRGACRLGMISTAPLPYWRGLTNDETTSPRNMNAH
jgi:hypothetical protein